MIDVPAFGADPFPAAPVPEAAPPAEPGVAFAQMLERSLGRNLTEGFRLRLGAVADDGTPGDPRTAPTPEEEAGLPARPAGPDVAGGEAPPSAGGPSDHPGLLGLVAVGGATPHPAPGPGNAGADEPAPGGTVAPELGEAPIDGATGSEPAPSGTVSGFPLGREPAAGESPALRAGLEGGPDGPGTLLPDEGGLEPVEPTGATDRRPFEAAASEGIEIPRSGPQVAVGASLAVDRPAPASPPRIDGAVDAAPAPVPGTDAAPAVPGPPQPVTVEAGLPPAATVEAVGARSEEDPPLPEATTPPDGVDEAVSGRGSARAAATSTPGPARLANRIEEIVDLVEGGRIPRRVLIEVPELDDVRLAVSVRGSTVTITAPDRPELPRPVAAWMTELRSLLADRGLDLGDPDGRDPRRERSTPEPYPAPSPNRFRPRRIDEALRI
ncbi:MAG TPA: hypothetical protein ENK55_08810 [Actinobacteria bacterium]|nr:hypothetical protein [Actinomycetota bacterium]